jgi:hypothetical protein
MPIRAWFLRFIHCEPLEESGLADECRWLSAGDAAGRKWCANRVSGERISSSFNFNRV